jgi:hypothetical protein
VYIINLIFTVTNLLINLLIATRNLLLINFKTSKIN